jgi:excisionase family DNA binding protein
LGVSKPLIDKLVAQKAIPSYKIGKLRLFDREELFE